MTGEGVVAGRALAAACCRLAVAWGRAWRRFLRRCWRRLDAAQSLGENFAASLALALLAAWPAWAVGAMHDAFGAFPDVHRAAMLAVLAWWAVVLLPAALWGDPARESEWGYTVVRWDADEHEDEP